MIFPYRVILALLVSVLCLTVDSKAQEGERNAVGLAFGGSVFHLKDVHASPLIFRGTGIAPAAEYLYRGKECRQEVEASYYAGELATSNTNFTTKNWRARIRYAYLAPVLRFAFLNEQWDLFAGGSLESFFCKSDYWYSLAGRFNGRSISSWYWSHSLDCSAQLECPLASGEYLAIAASLPLVSNVSRPVYSPAGDYNYDENDWKIKVLGETRVFPRNFSMIARVMYVRPLASAWSLHLGYEFASSSYDRPADVDMYMNALRAGVLYSF